MTRRSKAMVQNFGVGRTVSGATWVGAGGEASADDGALGEGAGDFGAGFVPGLGVVLGASMFGATLPFGATVGAAPLVAPGTLGGAVSSTEGAAAGTVTLGEGAADTATVAIAEAAGTLEEDEAPRAFS